MNSSHDSQILNVYSGNLIKMQILWSFPKDSDSGGLEWDSSIFGF